MWLPAATDGADAQRAGVGEGAVAEVLEEVVDVDEGLDADPVHALAAHLGVAGDVTDPLGVHQPDEAVAADAAADERVRRAPSCPVECGQPEQ